MNVLSYEELSERRAALRQRFEHAPEVVIQGVVGTIQPSAAHFAGDANWWIEFELCRWQLPGQAISELPLRVAQASPDADLRPLAAHIQHNALIAFRAKLCEQSPFGDSRAQLLEILPPPAGLIEPPEPPAPVPKAPVDERLRGIWFQPAHRQFFCEVDWLGAPLALRLKLDANSSVDTAWAAARPLLDAAVEWTERFVSASVEQLLALKNSRWLDETEAPVTAEEFRQRLVPKTLVSTADGELLFYFADGDLFFGHQIEVSASAVGGVLGVKLCN